MAKVEKFIANNTRGKVLKILCPQCKRPTEHRVTVSLDKYVQLDRYDGIDAEWVDHYQVVQCEGCKGVSFRHAAWFSDDVDMETGYDGRAEWLYPKRGANSLRCKDLPNVPTVLRRIYGEVIQCFNNDCLTLSAVGLRAVVEGVCADKSVLDGPVT